METPWSGISARYWSANVTAPASNFVFPIFIAFLLLNVPSIEPSEVLAPYDMPYCSTHCPIRSREIWRRYFTFHVPCATCGTKVSNPDGGKERAHPCSAAM